MYCIHCGQQIADGSPFCTACGGVQNAGGAARSRSAATPGTVMPQTPQTRQTDWTNSFFDGGLLGLVGVNIVVFFVSLLTIGLAWPALQCFKLRWVYRHTVVGGYRLRFTGTGMQLFGKYILWVLLTIITVTIYAWWLPIKYRKWEVSHLEIDSMIPNNQ